MSTINHFTAYAYKGFINRMKSILSDPTVAIDINEKDAAGYTALIRAVSQGHKQVVEYLLSINANVNVIGPYQQTALIFALCNDHIEIAKLLINAGTDVNLANEDNNSPIHYAVEKDDVELVQMLLERNANVNLLNHLNHNCLMPCCNNTEIYRLLLDAGADTTVVDYQNNSVLSFATRTNNINKFLPSLSFV